MTGTSIGGAHVTGAVALLAVARASSQAAPWAATEVATVLSQKRRDFDGRTRPTIGLTS